MTEQSRIELQKEVLYSASLVRRNCEAVRVKLATIGERLVCLGKALQNHPEQVKPLPEVHAEYDYREALNEMGSARQQIIDLCDELRNLEQQKMTTEQRVVAVHL